jgi:hypothetical protein
MKFCPSSPGKGGGLEERERKKEGSRWGRFSRSPTKEFCQVN